MNPYVASIVCTPASVADPRPNDHYARVPIEVAELVVNHGIAGDLKGSRGKRQLNVMGAEAVESLRAEGYRADSGELGEQLVLAGLAVDALAPGERLRLGAEAVIEVVMPRTGCDRFARIQGKPKQSADGRLGVMARVVRGGAIRVGDPVQREGSAAEKVSTS